MLYRQFSGQLTLPNMNPAEVIFHTPKNQVPPNYTEIPLRQQKQRSKDLKRKNERRIKHNYKVGDSIFLKNEKRKHKLDKLYLEPYPIVKVFPEANNILIYKDGIFTNKLS
eukprot:NODE_357_length_8846_cov_0.279410.p7 type:complete len:111 gc:universal NODE_357_length_8846_cov_0.279410:4321-4653(+)